MKLNQLFENEAVQPELFSQYLDTRLVVALGRGFVHVYVIEPTVRSLTVDEFDSLMTKSFSLEQRYSLEFSNVQPMMVKKTTGIPGIYPRQFLWLVNEGTVARLAQRGRVEKISWVGFVSKVEQMMDEESDFS